jgi:hypothetical protein
MYLPFVKAKSHPVMGLQPLMLKDWIEIDQDFVSQLGYKKWLLAHRYKDVFAALADTQAAQLECLDLLIDHLLQHFPDVYQQSDYEQGRGTVCAKQTASDTLVNRLTGERWRCSDFAIAPLDLAARLVQEDLCLMMPGRAGYQLAAASVCFPLRWQLREKLSQPISQIHQQVPGYATRLARPVDHMFNRLREDCPSLRFNWSVVDSPELHLTQEKYAIDFNPEITAKNAPEKLWLRVERQTLRRLPINRGILFTIRTYIYPITQVIGQPEVAVQLANAIQALHPNMQKYKNLLPFRQALLAYLGARIK